MTSTRRTDRHRPRVFRDRRDAGRVLAGLLTEYRGRDDVVVLGLARGGVPVAAEVAARLGAPLDAVIVRKLGAPGHQEFAVGALAAGGRLVLNDDVLADLRIPAAQLRAITDRETRELTRRENAYRGGRPALPVAGKVVILVDDGVATGASMAVAAQLPRAAGAARLVIAVPTGPASMHRRFRGIADEVVCASSPEPFLAVGQSYSDFTQVGDDEVRRLLGTAIDPA